MQKLLLLIPVLLFIPALVFAQPVQNLQIDNIGVTSFDVKWDKHENNKKYKVLVIEPGKYQDRQINLVRGLHTTITDLEPDTKYKVVVFPVGHKSNHKVIDFVTTTNTEGPTSEFVPADNPPTLETAQNHDVLPVVEALTNVFGVECTSGIDKPIADGFCYISVIANEQDWNPKHNTDASARELLTAFDLQGWGAKTAWQYDRYDFRTLHGHGIETFAQDADINDTEINRAVLAQDCQSRCTLLLNDSFDMNIEKPAITYRVGGTTYTIPGSDYIYNISFDMAATENLQGKEGIYFVAYREDGHGNALEPRWMVGSVTGDSIRKDCGVECLNGLGHTYSFDIDKDVYGFNGVESRYGSGFDDVETDYSRTRLAVVAKTSDAFTPILLDNIQKNVILAFNRADTG